MLKDFSFAVQQRGMSTRCWFLRLVFPSLTNGYGRSLTRVLGCECSLSALWPGSTLLLYFHTLCYIDSNFIQFRSCPELNIKIVCEKYSLHSFIWRGNIIGKFCHTQKFLIFSNRAKSLKIPIDWKKWHEKPRLISRNVFQSLKWVVIGHNINYKYIFKTNANQKYIK